MKIKTKLSEQDYFLYDQLCSIMDEDKKKKAFQTCEYLKLKPHFFMIGCDEVVLLEGEDTIIIAVSGSDKDKEEWRGNFNPYRGLVDMIKKAPKNKKGFHYNYYLQARHLKRIIKAFLKANPHIKNVILVGHSRGGAIALDCYMLLAVEDNLVQLMVVPVDPPRSFTRKGWKWFKKNCKQPIRIHRIKAFIFILGVGSVPPFILGWIHRQSTLLKLSNVRGKFNHTAITEGLERKFKRKQNEKK